jgi:uncharacterized protein YggE
MKTLPTLALAAALAAWVSDAPAQVVVESATRSEPTISVSGTAEVRVPPDEVLLTLGIESRNRSLDDAKTQNDRGVADLLQFLKGAGIESKDVQTDHVGIHPQYQSGRQDVIEFYIVQRSVGIRLRRVADFEKILTGALKSGVTHVHGIDFRTTELRKHRDTARQLAIRAAREKANDLARELDVKVGKVQSITENTWGGYWGGGYWGARGFGGMAQNTIQNAAVAEPPPEPEGGGLSVGQISVSATVNVSFQLESAAPEAGREPERPR